MKYLLLLFFVGAPPPMQLILESYCIVANPFRKGCNTITLPLAEIIYCLISILVVFMQTIK